MKRSLPVLGLLVLAGCAATDPCSGVAGTCIALRVKGPAGAPVDRLDVTASGATHSSTRAATWLPVQLAISLPASVSGDVELGVTGYLGGTSVGAGTTTVTIIAGGHS